MRLKGKESQVAKSLVNLAKEFGLYPIGNGRPPDVYQ
jgi:hypothetical protein